MLPRPRPRAKSAPASTLSARASEPICRATGANAATRARDVVKAPLFPGYIFIELDLEQSPWRSINGTFGVTRLVCHADTPAAVPPGIVEEIQARAGADGLVELPPACLREGQALRIVSGALADCRGLFERMADRDRVILLLDLLGRKVRVEAPLSAVAGAWSPAPCRLNPTREGRLHPGRSEEPT